METILIKNALKGGEFTIKESSADDIFIPELMNEEQRMILQTCHDFVDNEVRPYPKSIENQPKLLRKAGDLGLLGAYLPEEYGGMEMDVNTITVMLDPLGKSGGSFNTSFAVQTGIGMLPILYFGTDIQKEKYLPKICSGEIMAAYCLTEPSSGSDALAAKTRADLSEDASHYVLNGQKMWISNAGFADVFIVFAKIDGIKFTAFIVDANSEGLSLGAEEDKMGIKGSSTRQVFFENVKVPSGNLLGEIGKGHHIAFNVLNIGRFKLGNMCVGGSKYAIGEATRYANERVQFKVPISSFGAMKHKLGEMCIRNFALESSVYRISNMIQEKKNELIEQGMSYPKAMQESAKEYAIECAIIKVHGSEVLDFCVDELVQIHGGNGFSEEYMAAEAYRDSRINRIYEGTNEINRLLTVSQLLKLAMKGKIDLASNAWAVQKELASMPKFETQVGVYGVERKSLKDFKKILLMVAGAATKQQMEGILKLEEEQEIVMNIADIMIDVFAAESLLLRVERLEAMIVKPADQEIYDAILKTFFADTQARIQKAASDALCSFAEGDLLKIMLMGLKRFVKYPPVNVKKNRRLIADLLISENDYCL